MSRMASLAEIKEGVWVNGRRLFAEKGSAGTDTVRWKPSVTPVVRGMRGMGEIDTMLQRVAGEVRTLSDAGTDAAEPREGILVDTLGQISAMGPHGPREGILGEGLGLLRRGESCSL